MSLWDCDSKRHQQLWPRTVLSTWPPRDMLRPQDRQQAQAWAPIVQACLGWVVCSGRSQAISILNGLPRSPYSESQQEGKNGQSPWGSQEQRQGSKSLPDKSQDGLGRIRKGWISEAGKISLVHIDKIDFTTSNVTFYLKVILWQRKT